MGVPAFPIGRCSLILRATHRRRIYRVELAGAAIFATAIVWTFLVGSNGEPAPVAAILVGSGVVLVIGRAFTGKRRVAVPAAVLVIAATVAIGSRGELLSARPLSGPFGYANAKGAFFMLAAIAGLMVAAGASNLPIRLIGVAAAIGAAMVPVSSHVAGSTILLLVIPIPAALIALAGRAAALTAIALCGALFLIAVGGTIALGARSWSHPTTAIEIRVRDVLTYNRLELWHEAERLMISEPLRGIGPGRFGERAPLSRKDLSNLLFWAQNDFLQQGAEQGVLGLVLLLGLFAWGFVALGANPDVDVFVVLAAAALAVVGIQACEDYVLHFPAVALSTAALVGAGIVPSSGRGIPKGRQST